MQAARVVHQVVLGEGQFGAEDVAVVEARGDARRVRALARPGEGGRREVDGVHLEAARGEVHGVAAGPAAEVQHPCAGRQQAAVEPSDEVLVRLVDEERPPRGPVGVEAVPPVGGPVGPAVRLGAEEPVEQVEDVVDGADGAVQGRAFRWGGMLPA